MKRLYARLSTWLRRPIRVELDADSIAVARPGDVVVLCLQRDLSPSHLAGFRSSLEVIAADSGVKFFVVEPAAAVRVRPAGVVASPDGSWELSKGGEFRLGARADAEQG